jgi:protein disulfide-isomerase
VLADFTESDGHKFCKKLKEEVFDTPEFQKWAREKFVLLELDYPRTKAQSDEVKRQNAALKEKYRIQGVPTVVFLDGNEQELGRVVAYGGKDTWMKQAKAIVDRH